MLHYTETIGNEGEVRKAGVTRGVEAGDMIIAICRCKIGPHSAMQIDGQIHATSRVVIERGINKCFVG